MQKTSRDQIPFTPNYNHQQTNITNQSSLSLCRRPDTTPEKQCRICLEKQDQQTLLKACKCKGSVGFVHSNCLAQWILKKGDSNNHHLSCELCREQFKFNTKISSFFSPSFFLEKLRQETLKLLLIICLYLSFLVGNIYLTVLIKKASDEPAEGELREKLFFGPQMQMILTTIVSFLFVVLLVIGLAFFGAYFTQKETQVEVLPFEIQQSTRPGLPSKQDNPIQRKPKPLNLKIVPVQ